MTTILGHSRPLVAFLFPGQGLQYARMGAGLAHSVPAYGRHFSACVSRINPLIADDIERLIRAPRGSEDADRLLNSAHLLQPALFAVEYSLARTLIDFGIAPDIVAGHSIGEYAAACIAGSLTLDDAIGMVITRGAAMEGAGDGAMLIANTDEKHAVQYADDNEAISLASENSPGDMVFSGPPEAIERFSRQLRALDVPCRKLNVRLAFHSPMMNGPASILNAYAADKPFRIPEIPLVSNLTGGWMNNECVGNPTYWGRQMTKTVRFAENIMAIFRRYKDTPIAFVEVGPGRSLIGSVARTVRKALDGTPQPLMVNCMRSAKEEPETEGDILRDAIARLEEAGITANPDIQNCPRLVEANASPLSVAEPISENDRNIQGYRANGIIGR